MQTYEGCHYFKWANGEVDDTSWITWVLVILPPYLASPHMGPRVYGSRWPTDAQTKYAEHVMDRKGIALMHPAPCRQPGAYFASPPHHEVVGQRYLITQRAGYDV
jgi:hypothetical protein